MTARRKKTLSRQDRLIGYAVLGAGILALLTVLTLAMARHGRGPAAMQSIGIEKALRGAWIAQFNGYGATFESDKDGFFQLIAVQQKEGGEHYYSRGRLVLDGNRMTLTPDQSLGAPKSDDPATPFKFMTYGTYTVELRRQDGDLVWLPVEDGEGRVTERTTHPLIQYGGQGYIVWSPES